MRRRAALGYALVALAPAGAQAVSGGMTLHVLHIEGGSPDDQAFARSALGLQPGTNVDAAGFQQALEAVRLVDRFRRVDGHLDPDGVAWVRLDPVAALATWSWTGDAVPKPLQSRLLPELQKGQFLGPMRLATFRGLAERRLREAGYPAASVTPESIEGGRQLHLRVTLGPPDRILAVTISGQPAPYSREQLLKAAGLQPGRTLWTEGLAGDIERRIRQRFIKNHRLEGTVRVIRVDPARSTADLEVQPGPVVRVKAQGLSLFGTLAGRPRLTDFVPLARAERYAPSLLDEGSGRIAAYYRDQGYPEVKVTYDRRVTAGPPDRPEAVTITYHVFPGPRRVIRRVWVEGNVEYSESALLAVLEIPRRNFVQLPYAKGDTMRALEDRLGAFYLQRGFTDVRVRRRVETNPDGSVDVHLVVREGRQRFLRELDLDLPPDLPADGLDQSLLLVLSDHPTPLKGGLPGRYGSDRRNLQGYTGRLLARPTGRALVLDRPIPLVRNDLALVVSGLRQRLSSLGAANPHVHLSLGRAEDAGEVVRIQVPPQNLDTIRRLVVQGSDRTRAEAVLREAQVRPGMPLDPIRLDESQVRIAGLGAFQRVDLLTVSDLPGQTQPPWTRGDLALQLQERSPWVFTEAFGYDRTQGYHFGWNAQRLDVGGMGRVLDFGARAGDQTLDIPALRRAFPTGDVKRSLDTYSIGYTDPWFSPGSLASLLPDRTRLHVEGAYIEEAQAAFFARRRRFTTSLEWRLSSAQTVSLGYRFERVEVAANTDANNVPLISNEDLFYLARTPPRSIISAPYLQLVVDRRDRPYDPTAGTYFLAHLELANQVFGTSANSSFVKLDVRQQWNWPVGFRAEHGVVSAGVRVGLARPTAKSAEDLPLSERFFGGGPFSVRGVEPDMLGAILRTTGGGTLLPQIIPLGGQGLALVTLEYRFPFLGMQSIWGEVFTDSGQVYRSLSPDPGAQAPFPPFRTTLGVGLILKLGFPLKIEYAADWKRILGQPRTQDEQDTQLKSLLISAGFQF